MKDLKKKMVLMTAVFLALHLLVGNLNFAYAETKGSVVINEIAWAGTSGHYNDEWIELYNTTSKPIDLTGFVIEDDGAPSYVISGGTIPAHGYFVIEDSEISISNQTAGAVISLSLANAGDSLVLKDNLGNIIDSVNGSGGSWYAGNATTKATMERIDPYNTVDSASNWATAKNGNGALGRDGGEILGTPGSANSNYSGEGPVVRITPSTLNAEVGSNITLNVVVEDVIDLFSYGFEMLYDPSVLKYVSTTEAGFLKADGASTGFFSALEGGEEGKLLLGNARFINPQSGIDGSGTLFTVTFNVISEGSGITQVGFAGSGFMSDSVGDILYGSYGNEINLGDVVSGVVINLSAKLGTERFSFDLSWEDPNGSDLYIVSKKAPDGKYYEVARTANKYVLDNLNILPGVVYDYQVVAVKDGVASSPAFVNALDVRGIVGDFDKNDRVDGRDLEKLARAYGSVFGDEEYDITVDANFDGVIDGSDLIDIGANFGLVYK